MPMRIFTVTGTDPAFSTAARTIRSNSLRLYGSAAPPPRRVTLGTGQPKFMSMWSARSRSTIMRTDGGRGTHGAPLSPTSEVDGDAGDALARETCLPGLGRRLNCGHDNGPGAPVRRERPSDGRLGAARAELVGAEIEPDLVLRVRVRRVDAGLHRVHGVLEVRPRVLGS